MASMLVLALSAADPAPGVSGQETRREAGPPGWPAITKDNMPGTRWWWMGSAVVPGDLARELETYRQAAWLRRR